MTRGIACKETYAAYRSAKEGYAGTFMTKQKFYETVDKYLMAMGINIEEYSDLKELTLKFFAVHAALECQSMFDAALDTDPCSMEEERCMQLCTPELDDADLEEKLRILIERRDEWYAAH